MPPSKSGYSRLQIGLHWMVAALVLFQLLFGESMAAAVDAIADGAQASSADQTLASAHYWVGLSILALVIMRLGLRATLGAPASEPATPAWMSIASRATHWAFYGLLFAAPISGLLAYYAWDWMGDVHSFAKPVFIVLVGVHAAAALFHHFVLKDGTLRRILAPSTSPSASTSTE